MTGPRPLSDPRPVVYMGPVASVAAGFISMASLMLALYLGWRRWK